MSSNYKALSGQLQEMNGYIGSMDIRNPAVSTAPVGWHLAHNLKVIDTVMDALNKSDPKQYKSTFSLRKALVFLTGRIPRGIARSPKAALPPELIERKDIVFQIEKARQKIRILGSLPKNAHFDHPYFGKLNRKKTEKFLVIHTRHHLKIIKDILTVRNN